ncbi:AAA family ATPase [Flavobacterium ginsenosidimutans]|uniref:AAA family ATPase n=1 Tax=Flavobacterium ginsenosidimutans TaxID=687844 RepID=A0ABZ2Q6G3_9FLAO
MKYQKKNQYQNFYVITGGPGVGKTSVIDELSQCGYSIAIEDARRIIREQIVIQGDGLPWRNKSLYAQLMLEASIETYQRINADLQSEKVFFDRGILDTLCYMNMEQIPIPSEVDKLISDYPYNRRVFILPPWEEIYKTDNERKQSWDEAIHTFDMMKQTYLHYGYEVIEVPKNSIKDRCQFILSQIQ